MCAGFLCPKCDNFACFTYPPRSRWDSSDKMIFFFAKIGIFCKSLDGPLPSVVQAYTQPYSFGGKIKLMVFSFLPNNVHFVLKNAISCLFLKNVSPPKRVICFILNNLHFPMVEGIAFYALHKSRVLIIPCKADGFCLFIRLPDEIYKYRLVSLSTWEFNFFIVLKSILKETLHY